MALTGVATAFPSLPAIEVTPLAFIGWQAWLLWLGGWLIWRKG
ncbi:hypothetical protein [Elstera litoralis]|nr:hypothetical protein [Elstera litoralis]